MKTPINYPYRLMESPGAEVLVKSFEMIKNSPNKECATSYPYLPNIEGTSEAPYALASYIFQLEKRIEKLERKINEKHPNTPTA